MEIERKFLLAEMPVGAARHPSRPIAQGYLAIAPDGVEVRLRRDGDETRLTVKSGPGSVRVEEELELDARRFEALWPLTAGRRVVKTRFVVALDDGLAAEVDRYADALQGLVTAEVEFPDEASAGAFVPPAWLGTEITGDPRYANQTLALHGRPAT